MEAPQKNYQKDGSTHGYCSCDVIFRTSAELAWLLEGAALQAGSGQRRLWGRSHWEGDPCNDLYVQGQPLAGKPPAPRS